MCFCSMNSGVETDLEADEHGFAFTDLENLFSLLVLTFVINQNMVQPDL